MTGEPEDAYLETPAVLRLAGIPYSSLDYWVRTGLVSPSIRTGEGKRKTRRWSIADAVCVLTLKELRDAGAPVRLLVRAREHLKDGWHQSLTSKMLFWDGGDVLLLDDWEKLVSLIREPGQSTLRIVALPLGRFASDAAAEVVSLTIGSEAPIARTAASKRSA
ncbi:MAG: MerR family transcriptional regulator [Leifsonia sp.]